MCQGEGAGSDGVVVPPEGSGVVLPVSEGLLDGCGLGPELVGGSDADGLGVPVPAVLVASGDGLGVPVPAVLVASGDGLGVPVPAVLVPVGDGLGAAVLLEASGCRICSICCSYCCSCAWISVRLTEVMCWPKVSTCFQRASSCAAVEPCGAAGNEMSSWTAIAAVRQLMQL